MPIQPESASRLYQQVADRIAGLIQAGKFTVGTRLPPERDLADQFNVSRPTIREALVALEIAKMIEVRTGSGAYVCPATSRAANTAHSVEAGPSAFELIKARRMLEPAMTAEAAVTRTKSELVEIANAMELFEQRRKGTHWEMLEVDRVFHLCIARATHNDRIVRVVESLWQDMFSPIFAILSSRTKLAEKKVLTMHDHRTIFSCIERRDGPGAEAAMLSHLVHAEMKLLKSEIDSAPQNSSRAAPRRSVLPGRSKPERATVRMRGRTRP